MLTNVYCTCFGPGVEYGDDKLLKALFTDGVSDLMEAECCLWLVPELED